MNPQAKLSICIFSDPNFLALNILENLLSKNCSVNVVTSNAVEWKNSTRLLTTNSKLSITDRKNFDIGDTYDYAFFCGGFIKSSEAYTGYSDFVSLPNLRDVKALVIFPFEVFDRNKIDKIKFSNNSAVVFIGDLVGPRINLESDLTVNKTLSEILWKRIMTLGVGETFYPIFVPDAIRLLIRWLFSFGPYGKTTLLLGSQVSGDVFWKENKKHVGDLQLVYDSKKQVRTIPKGIETETVNSNLEFSLKETYDWLRNNWAKQPKMPEKKKEKARVKVPVARKPWVSKKVKSALAIFGIIFAFPFISLVISLFISFIAYKSFVSGNDGFSQNSLLLARGLTIVSEKESSILGYIPGIGLVYKELEFASSFTGQSNLIGIHAMPVVRDSTSLLENVLGDAVYDSATLSLKIESDLALLYNDVMSVKSLTDKASERNIVLSKKILSKIDFERFVNLVSQSRVLAGNFPQLLGKDKSKTYLVLFENNMELRPTGGFIGSFGLVTFDGGRLSDLTVNDVYSADGQLNGHVEPPLPIKNYLGEANWWLRDSNWDPDFPTSAKRAEWFLDKEISKQVDGVVAIDLFPVKEILKYTGPVFLSDYNLNITADNLYEKTQSEVENNFFPGTHKKASFLTALSRSLLTEVVKLKMNQKLGILQTFYNGLSGRHVQLYLHDQIPQQVFSSLGWDGAVAIPGCGADCYPDLVGIVEANVGMNKVNYFIKRNINLEVTPGTNGIKHKLTLSLKNPANPALGPSGRYKAYIRALMPVDTYFNSVVSYNGNVQEILSPEITEVKGHKEVGVLVELLAGNTKNIEFSWTTDFNGKQYPSNYGLYIRKQAGTDADPISINIQSSGVLPNPDPRLALTKDGSYRYNTTLARDLFLRPTW